jgi:alkylated DNA nucleotide flippase Atl1
VAVPIAYSKQVIRNPATAFKGTLDLTRNLAFVNEPAVTLARVAVDPALVLAGSVKLVEVQANGSETEVGVMVDNGKLAQGDEVQGDGIYSAQVTVLGTAEGVRNYRAVATLAGSADTARSVSRAVQIATRLPDATLTAILDTQQASTDRLKTAAATGPAALKSAITAEVVTLRANADVAVASSNDAGTAISVLYKSGIAGVIGEPAAALKGGSATHSTSLRGQLASLPAAPIGIGAAIKPTQAPARRKGALLRIAPRRSRLAASRSRPSPTAHRRSAATASTRWPRTIRNGERMTTFPCSPPICRRTAV